MNTNTTPLTGIAHQSVRTCMAMNRDAVTGEQCRELRTSRLDMRWVGGELAISFSASTVPVAPRPSSYPTRRR